MWDISLSTLNESFAKASTHFSIGIFNWTPLTFRSIEVLHVQLNFRSSCLYSKACDPCLIYSIIQSWKMASDDMLDRCYHNLPVLLVDHSNSSGSMLPTRWDMGYQGRMWNFHDTSRSRHGGIWSGDWYSPNHSPIACFVQAEPP